MNKVFVGGSRNLSRLNRKVIQILDRIIEKNMTILVGDANGADRALQNYLQYREYRNVIVFCMQNMCRNNLGSWKTRYIATTLRNNTFKYYSVKDLEMVEESDYGFMLWDSKSKGTLNNIVNLLTQYRPTIVYFSPTKSLHQLESPKDLPKILDKCDQLSIEKFEKDLNISQLILQPSLWQNYRVSDNE